MKKTPDAPLQLTDENQPLVETASENSTDRELAVMGGAIGLANMGWIVFGPKLWAYPLLYFVRYPDRVFWTTLAEFWTYPVVLTVGVFVSYWMSQRRKPALLELEIQTQRERLEHREAAAAAEIAWQEFDAVATSPDASEAVMDASLHRYLARAETYECLTNEQGDLTKRSLASARELGVHDPEAALVLLEETKRKVAGNEKPSGLLALVAVDLGAYMGGVLATMAFGSVLLVGAIGVYKLVAFVAIAALIGLKSLAVLTVFWLILSLFRGRK
jgi:hypothetical protein